LLDEFFDEWGLYLVHHQRWVTSRATTVAVRKTTVAFGFELWKCQQILFIASSILLFTLTGFSDREGTTCELVAPSAAA
jgi:hypothetical protein